MSDTSYYPPPAFAFSVILVSGSATQAATSIDAAFQEISGIDPHIETEEVVEGGLNSFVHLLPGVTKHSNLVLKRGYVIASSNLAKWAASTVGTVLGTPIVPQTLNVNLLDATQQPLVTWTFAGAWPVKWEVGPLNSTDTSAVLTQRMEFAYTTVTTTTRSS